MNGAVENQLVNKWKASEGRSLLEMATGYKSSKDIPPLTSMSREKVHNALLAAGMTPGLGNVADAADALLYAAEGEFGSAGLSAAAMVPMVGQFVNAKRAVKAAKASGEEMVTLYRGVDKWHQGKMVTKGKFTGGFEVDPGFAKFSPKAAKSLTEKFGMELHTTPRRGLANYYSKLSTSKGASRIPSLEGVVLEFEVPRSYVTKNMNKKILKPLKGVDEASMNYEIVFKEGLPKEFLKKVHK